MNVLRVNDPHYSQKLSHLTALSSLFDPTVEQAARSIIEGVFTRGDSAVLEFTERFDRAKLTVDQLAVTKAELLQASLKAKKPLRDAITLAARNIERFSRKSLRRNWTATNAQGGKVGEKFDPFQRVGIYIPGGTAPLVSTALMTVLLARVAGCPEIVVCTPCGGDGAVNPALLFAMRSAGATEIYRVGGAQAIAAMAFGTSTIRRVQKVFGPGNAYVVAAKRLLFGHVAIDLLPGPSEVLVLADDTANPAFVAADLLAQAEHGSGHERVWLITPSLQLISSVAKEVDRQLPRLARRDFINHALKQNGWLVQVKTLEQGVALVNRVGPEHCELMLRRADSVAKAIRTAGAIFIGAFSPTVLGDYVAGPSHTLPTGGAGLSFAGLTVDQFQRRTSIVEYSRVSLGRSLKAVQTFAEVEGLDAHAASAAIRLESKRMMR